MWEWELQYAPEGQRYNTDGRGEAIRREQWERGREGENISDGRACAGVLGVLQGEDGGMDRSQGSRLDL